MMNLYVSIFATWPAPSVSTIIAVRVLVKNLRFDKYATEVSVVNANIIDEADYKVSADTNIVDSNVHVRNSGHYSAISTDVIIRSIAPNKSETEVRNRSH